MRVIATRREHAMTLAGGDSVYIRREGAMTEEGNKKAPEVGAGLGDSLRIT
jgi:hypothetical protein